MSRTSGGSGSPSTLFIESSVLDYRDDADTGSVGVLELRHAERVVRRLLRSSQQANNQVVQKIREAAYVIHTTTRADNEGRDKSCLVATAAIAARIASQVLNRIRRNRV